MAEDMDAKSEIGEKEKKKKRLSFKSASRRNEGGD
jgi:hypothetical protein